MMTTNLFVIGNVKQLRTGGSFRILLHFFRISWGVGVLNSAIFNSFHNRVEFGTILEDVRNLGGGGFEHPKHPSVRQWSRRRFPRPFCVRTNTDMFPQVPGCYCLHLMQTYCFKFITIKPKPAEATRFCILNFN